MPDIPPPGPAAPDAVLLVPPMPWLARGDVPLYGLTLLVVEDSRFASDALRLLGRRSGARLRRAATLRQARAHLRVYRPDVVLVDLGLPDGRGEGLIRALAASGPGRPAILGMSGDPDGRGPALAAGADGFMEKPVPGLAAFRQAILSLLPGRSANPAPEPGEEVAADPAALHDDLLLAAQAVGAGPGAAERRYLAGFLAGLARQAHDEALCKATAALHDPRAGLQDLARLLEDRLAESAPFAAGSPMAETG